MRKLHTRLLLLALSLTASASAVGQTVATEPVTTLTAGWYAVKLTNGQAAFLNNYVVAKEAGTYPYNQYGSYGTELSPTLTNKGLVYVKPVSGNNYHFINESGFYSNNAGSTLPTATNLNMVYQTTAPLGWKIGSNTFWGGFTNLTNLTQAPGGNKNGLGASSGYGTNRWSFYPVTFADNGKKVYKVVIDADTKAIADYTTNAKLDLNYIIEYNNANYQGEHAIHNGGFLFMDEGTEFTTTSFITNNARTTTTEPETSLKRYLTANPTSVVVTDADFATTGYHHLVTIKLGYQVTLAQAQASTQLSDLAGFQAKEATVGYPKPTSAAVQGIQSVFDNLVSSQTYSAAAVNTARNNYYNETDILYPEDGKAYMIVSEVNTGSILRYWWYDAATNQIKRTQLAANQTPEQWIAALPSAGRFVCHEIDATNHRYIFTNDNGKCLTFRGNSATQSQDLSGFLPYDATKSAITVKKHPTGTAVTGGLTPANGLGKLALQAKRKDQNALSCFTSANTENTWAQGGATNFFNNSSWSTVLRLYEVPYPNQATLRPGGDDKNYATLMLPFLTTIPEGVQAWKAAVVDGANSKELALTEITGQLPANTPVVLTSQTETGALFVPAAAASVAAPADNALKGTINPAQAPTAGTKTFVLSQKNNQVGFYEYTAQTLPEYRAYLELESTALSTQGSGVQGLRFAFPGETTGLTSLPTGPQAGSQPVYDLQGRRVAQPQRGGLYIVAGRKVILK